MASTEKQILSFKIPALNITGIINEATKRIDILTNIGVDVSNIVPEIVISNLASVLPLSNTAINLTSAKKYTVTAEDLTTAVYSVVCSIDHNTLDLSIFKMVLNRLPFVEDTPNNRKVLSEYTLEVMNDLEGCFKVGVVDDIPVEGRVGVETYYSVFQKSIISDILATNILVNKAISNVGGNNQTLPIEEVETTYLKKVKAGSVEVEYDQVSLKDKMILAMDTSAMIARYREDAKRKLASIKCIYDTTDLMNSDVSHISMIFKNNSWEIDA